MPLGSWGLGNGNSTSPTATSGQGGLGGCYYANVSTGTATTTTCYTTCTGANNAIAYYDGQNWYTISQGAANTTYYHSQLAQQQPRESEADKQKKDQKAYQKALAEHNGQEAARLRRIISERDQAMAAQRAAEEKRKREYEAEQARVKAAAQRAEELLIEHLTPEQQKQYKDNKWFVIEGGKTKQKYRIRAGTLVANVDVLNDTGRAQHRLCAHARPGSVPMGDQLLAQKIILETDEDAFLRIANRHAA